MKPLLFALLAAAALCGQARAQSVKLNVDASLAEYLLGVVCSGEPVDEDFLRSSPAVASQIKHHSALSPERNMDAFIEGATAAAECEAPEKDLFRFGALVTDKETFAAEVAFFKGKAAEIETFVARSLTPYMPGDLDYDGTLVLSIVGNPCGGFSMDGQFFLALNCLRDDYEAQYEAAKVVSAHETYHDIQYEFFFPFDEDMTNVKTPDDGLAYLFMSLLLEGTAEYVADTRQITGAGVLPDLFRDMAKNAYGDIGFYVRLFGYTADVLATAPDVPQRLKDLYLMGFTGKGRQIFYFVGAAMARRIEEAWGRDALVCIMAKPPEQFVRAYQAIATGEPRDDAPPLAAAMAKGANRLGKAHGKDQRFEGCRA